MRTFAIIIPIVFIVVIGWSVTFKSIERHTLDFEQRLQSLSDHIKQNKWEDATTIFNEIQDKWSQVRKVWTVILDHHEMDNIDLSMAKVDEYLNSEDLALSVGEIKVLIELFRIVKENEALTLTNIL